MSLWYLLLFLLNDPKFINIKNIKLSENSAHTGCFKHGAEGILKIYEESICKPVSRSQITDIIKGMKIESASGVDNVSTSMLKHCGPLLNDMLTELVNCILTAVNGFLLSVVTKLIHRSMDFICEKLGYFLLQHLVTVFKANI